jgi:hypothetical protein
MYPNKYFSSIIWWCFLLHYYPSSENEQYQRIQTLSRLAVCFNYSVFRKKKNVFHQKPMLTKIKNVRLEVILESLGPYTCSYIATYISYIIANNGEIWKQYLAKLSFIKETKSTSRQGSTKNNVVNLINIGFWWKTYFFFWKPSN